MIEIVASALLLSGIALSSAVAIGSPRWRAPAAALALLVCWAVGLASGVLQFSDLSALPGHLGVGPELLLLLGWGVVAALLPAAGRPKLPKGWPPMVLAMGLGALLGELGAAAVLGAAATSRAAAARLALAAAGGALLGRMGDPALLVLGPRVGVELWMLVPLALVCAMVAWPMRGDLQVDEPPTPAEHPEQCSAPTWGVTAVAVAVGLAGQVRPLALPALALGAVALGVLGARHLVRRSQPAILVHVLAVAAMMLVVAAAGGPSLLGRAFESIQYDYAPQLPALAYLTGAIASSGLDSAGGGLFAATLLDATPGLDNADVPLALATGAALGGIGPLAVAGAVREGWSMWALQIVLGGGVLILILL